MARVPAFKLELEAEHLPPELVKLIDEKVLYHMSLPLVIEVNEIRVQPAEETIPDAYIESFEMSFNNGNGELHALSQLGEEYVKQQIANRYEGARRDRYLRRRYRMPD